MSAPPIDWPQIVPFAVGQTLAFRVTWLLAALDGSAEVLENGGPRLRLAFTSPEQRVLGRRIPRAVFVFGFESRAGGRGEAVLEIDGDAHADRDAVLRRQGRDVRADMAGPKGERLAFVIAPQGAKRVVLNKIAGTKVPPGARGTLISR
ncbi:MAG: hypothetical protein AAF684_01910 [Pseudomonadota bacterium]